MSVKVVAVAHPDDVKIVEETLQRAEDAEAKAILAEAEVKKHKDFMTALSTRLGALAARSGAGSHIITDWREIVAVFRDEQEKAGI